MKARFLIFGDIFSIAIITFIGFATHNEANISFIPRIAAVFFPLVIAWFLLAPWLGLFQPEITSNPRQLWRPAFAMLFAVPLAAFLRGLILNTPVIPIFVVVLSATTALGMVLWRGLYYLFNNKKVN